MLFEVVISLIIGVLIGFVVHKFILLNNKKLISEKVARILEQGEKEKENIEKEALQNSKEYWKEVELECKDISKVLENRKNVYDLREKNIKKKEITLQNTQNYIKNQKEEIKQVEKAIDVLRKEEIDKLLNISSVDREVACEELYKKIDIMVKQDYEHRLKSKLNEMMEIADQKAVSIIGSTIQRYSRRNAIRVVFPPIPVTKAFLKKEEANIKLLQEVTKAELDYNEEEGVMYISYYNLVRRTAAYEVFKKMVKQKKGKPLDVKNLLKEESDRIHKSMEKIGETIVKKLNIKDLPKEIVKLVGRLNYRTSFGQNIMSHSLEVAYFAEMLASEIGADVELTKRAALLHDLGKAVDQDIEGTHDLLTKQILEKYDVDEKLIHAAYNHHNVEEMKSVEARLVQAADAMSASRPGARIESGEQYAERIKALEKTALAIDGISKAYAIQAGREVRSFVDPEKISDQDMEDLAKRMAKDIEDNVQYPGQVMVNIIREIKITEQAK